jgi:integrase
MYRTRELAEELGVATQTVVMWAKNGVPHQRDRKGHIWIYGKAFATWVESQRGTRSRKRMADDHAYCSRCKKPVRSPESATRYWFLLKHLLFWADDIPLKHAQKIRPSFPAHLVDSRLDGKSGSLAPATLKKVVNTTKRFLTWAKLTYPTEFKGLSQLWIDSLRPPRAPEPPQDHEFVGLDEMLKLASLEIDEDGLILHRDLAAACLLFLSGMRGGALVSLPIEAIDLPKKTIQQWPSLGVRTKMGKSATTFLMHIPELLKPITSWDAHIRSRLPNTAMWYTPTINQWGDQILSSRPAGSGRVVTLGKRMRKLFAAAGIPYKSPHKFRHGHAVFALQNAQTMADYKAVSMNLMHSDISVTDGIYAPLAGEEVQRRIANLTIEPRDRPHSPVDFSLNSSANLSRGEVAQRLMDLARRLAS